ncbi:hypothetical protein Pmani_040283 [Petrolisthes manimaculis]|uniref:Uncharacterized protein n=1 Tax=Petrolisthes manimaculis TaxID=1843537 RepID=A0AAE1NB66_9EUCA|nr:hypothetical protein Pmani_040283 [Petrolisthes manimaculis]
MDNNPLRHFPEEVFGEILRTISISDYPDAYQGFEFHRGYCGNRSERPWEAIDDIDVGALQKECTVLATTTAEPSGPKEGDEERRGFLIL